MQEFHRPPKVKSLRQGKNIRHRRGKIRRRYRPGFEILEQRNLLVADWSNPLFPLDVDDDGFVSPIDALRVINDLQAQGSRRLIAPFDNNSTTAAYIDVNGDESVSPIDALLVINRLNAAPPRLGVSLELMHDTGVSSNDRITNDPQVQGQVNVQGATLSTARLRINRDSVMDLEVDSDGRFTLNEDTLAQLSDGDVKATVLLVDTNGVVGLRQLRYTLDTVAPPLSTPRIFQDDDTGSSDSDNVTRLREPRIEVSSEAGAKLQLRINDQTVFDGETPAVFRQAVAELTDGVHLLQASVTDIAGNRTDSPAVPLMIDTTSPTISRFDLAPTSASGGPVDFTTRAARVTLQGETEGNVFVTISGTAERVRSSGDGLFRLPNIVLATGANSISVQATDLAGNTSQAQQTFMRMEDSGFTDPVLHWNEATLEAIRLDATPPPMAARGMAMVSLAMLDVVNAIEGTPSYMVSFPASATISTGAAISTAAFQVLSYLYPGQAANHLAANSAVLSSIPEGEAKANAVALGTLVAEAIIALRARDGWNTFVDYVPRNQPGQWQETGPMFDVALLPQWGQLTPFAVQDVIALTPAGPPAFDSQQWVDDFNEVKSLGAAQGSTRTADQTQIARFWADGTGTYTPPGHWNEIAAQFARSEQLSSGESARLFAMLNVALNDAAIVSWNAKYTHELWRPVTAIRQADLDGNPLTLADRNWSSLLITPPFPEYTSGHSSFSGAAAEILTAYFGDDQPFSTTSLGLPGVTRDFTSFNQAAEEASVSRIYGGIHYSFSGEDGLASGRAVAQEVLDLFSVADDTRAPQIIFLSPPDATTTSTNPLVQGWVIDNLAGVASAEVRVNDGTFVPLTLDADGRFQFQPALSLDGTGDGTHVLRFRALDKAGLQSGEFAFTFTLDTQRPSIAVTSPAPMQNITATQRLEGTASGTGSNLIALTYQIDGRPPMPINFSPTGGGFSQSLDLSRIEPGEHNLTVTARDAAGLETTSTIQFTLGAMIPLTVSSHTPLSGASDVGSTFRPQVFFSRPINPLTLNATNFFAVDTTGSALPATIVPAQDGSFAWLFFQNPMPGGSVITIHVDGETILAADGTKLDANGNGTPGGRLQYSFSTVSLAVIPNTTIAGTVADTGPDLKPMSSDDTRAGADQVLGTADDLYLLPIAGVKIYVFGREHETVLTDASGQFVLENVPTGNVKLVVDGLHATNAPAGHYFPELTMDMRVEPGRENLVMEGMAKDLGGAAGIRGVFLPRLRSDILQPLADDQSTTIMVNSSSATGLTAEQRQHLSITVQPGSIVDPSGQPLADPRVGLSTVPREYVLDMLPNGLIEKGFVFTVQSPGAGTFTTPAAMTVPNTFNAPPGTKLYLMSADHMTGQLVIEGTATVHASGAYLSTDPGVGVVHPGWHVLTPPGTPGTGDNPPTPPPPCGEVPDGMRLQPGARLGALDPGLKALFPTIIANFPSTPQINHGNDGMHAANSRHYSNKAIDISGRHRDGHSGQE